MKIGIVNARASAVEALCRALACDPTHEVLWIARNGEEGVRLCARSRPDVVLMDLLMAGMDGVEATRRIMLQCPCAILIASDSLGSNGAKVFEAMGHGALDAVQVPELAAGDQTKAAPLLAKLRTISWLIRDDTINPTAPPAQAHGHPFAVPLVVIGASAGGPAALSELLQKLPVSTSAALVVVQHVDAQFARAMADWLGGESAWPFRVVEEGDRPTRGVALLAATSDHLVFQSDGRLGYTPDPKECVHRPSIDVFLQSLVREWRGAAIGVLLTGMGRDGALGLKAMRDMGHHTIAQDEASSAVYGMPKAAAKLGAASEILSLEGIAPRLSRLLMRKHGRET